MIEDEKKPPRHPIFELDRLFIEDPAAARAFLAKAAKSRSKPKKSKGTENKCTTQKIIEPNNKKSIKNKTKKHHKNKTSASGSEEKKYSDTSKNKAQQNNQTQNNHDQKIFPTNVNSKETSYAHNSKKYHGISCPLCGQLIKKGRLLRHKQEFHGEKSGFDSIKMPHNPNQWVKVYSGGLPSLGKKSR